MKYKAIFFDWDGVITDSVGIKTEAFAQLYRKYGTEIVERVVDFHLLHGGLSRFEKIRYFHKVFLKKDLDERELKDLADKFSEAVFDAITRSDFIPGAIRTITEEFSKGTLLFVVSGTPTQELIKIAEAKKLSQYFREIHGSPASKTDIVSELLEKYALHCAECIMIGDAMEDYHAALNNSVKFLGIAAGVNVGNVTFPGGTVVKSEVSV